MHSALVELDVATQSLMIALRVYRERWDGPDGERLWEVAIQAQERFDKAILACQNARKHISFVGWRKTMLY